MLSHFLFSTPIDFNEHALRRLTIEEPGELGRAVGELQSQISGYDGRFVLSDGSKNIELSKNTHMIIDPFSITCNAKEIITGLHKTITKELECGDSFLEVQDAISALTNYITTVSTEIEAGSSSGDVTIQALLKVMSVGMIEPESLPERVCEYVRLMSEYGSKRLAIIVNLDKFLSKEDYSELVKQLEYSNTPILLIENTFPNDNVPTKIIDTDRCELEIGPNGNLFEV